MSHNLLRKMKWFVKQISYTKWQSIELLQKMQRYVESRSTSCIYRWNGGGESAHWVTSSCGLSAWINSWGARTRVETRARTWWERAVRHLPYGGGNHQVGPVVQGTGLFTFFQCHWLCGSTNKESKEKTQKLKKQRYKYSLKLLILTKISYIHVHILLTGFSGISVPKVPLIPRSVPLRQVNKYQILSHLAPSLLRVVAFHFQLCLTKQLEHSPKNSLCLTETPMLSFIY